jgi:hypothetical protein
MYYVEEKVKILEQVIGKADPVLSDLFKSLEEFSYIQGITIEGILQKIDEIKFTGGEDEIKKIRKNKYSKVNVRNILGIQH